MACTGADPTQFKSFATVETGLSLNDHAKLADFMKKNAIDKKNVKFLHNAYGCSTEWGDGVVCHFSNVHDVDVVIDPRKSKILEVMGDRRLVPSKVFMTKHTLRFGRIGVQGPYCIPLPVCL
jgi:hypothetical protein